MSAAAGTTPTARKRTGVARLVSVIGAVLVVSLAMVAYRQTDLTGLTDVVPARLDQPRAFQSGQLLVSDVEVAGGIRVDGPDGEVLTTPGIFVLARITVQASGRGSVVVDDAQLRSGDRVYDAFGGSSTVSAPSGFESSKTVVFEVDPDDLAGARLECSSHGATVVYFTVVSVPLDLADDAAVATRGTVVDLPEPVRRVLR